MRLTLRFKDEHGWPIMSVEKPIVENKDSLKIQNYTFERYNDFKNICDMQRKATKAAKEKQNNAITRNYTYFSLFKDLFEHERGIRIIELEDEVRELKRKLSELEPPFPTMTGS